MKTLKNISAKVEISDLEDLGWDFTNIYEEVSQSKSLPLRDAERFEKDMYCVKMWIDENGVFSYSLCQKAHYGNEEFNQGDPGDVDAAIEDFKTLIDEDKVWDLKQY